MEELIRSFKGLFREKINIIILLLILILGVNIYNINFESENYIKMKKKIDHRYFNMTKSLEEIHKVDIDTHNGELKRTKY